MVAGPSPIKSHLRDMCIRLGLPEGEFILLRYSQVETMSDLYYRMPTLEMFEDFLYNEMFPYSGLDSSCRASSWTLLWPCGLNECGRAGPLLNERMRAACTCSVFIPFIFVS